MKQIRMIVSAAVVFAVVGGALAFKAPFGTGTLFCKSTSTGTCSTQKNFIPGTTLQRFCGSTLSACQSNTTTKIFVDQVAN